MGVAKVVLNGDTLIDTTGKTVAADKMLATYTALDKAGNNVTGNIAIKTSSDLTVSGATVTAPAGFYANAASKAVSSMTLPTAATSSATSGYTSKATIGRSTSAQYINIPPGYNSAGAYYTISAVANGTAGTPTAAKGTVSNHQISITPSVTNTTGYITGSTKTGTAVTVTASELASGSKEITSNGTGIDVVGYSTVDVTVPDNNFYLLYWFDSFGGPVGFDSSYADIKAAAQANKNIIVTNSQYYTVSAAKFIGYFTNYTFQTKTFTEGLAFRLDDPASNYVYDVMYGYSNGSLTQELAVYTDPPTLYTATILTSGNQNVVYVRLNNATKYYTAGDTFSFKPGDTLYMTARGQRGGSTIKIDGTTVATSADQYTSATYTYTLSANNIEIKLSYLSTSSINLTTLCPRPINITVNASAVTGTLMIPKLVYVKNPTSTTWSDKVVYYMSTLANDEYPYAFDNDIQVYIGTAPFTRTISSLPYMYLPDSEYKLAMLMPSSISGATFSGNISSEIYWAPDLRGFSTAFRLVTGDFTITFT